MVLSGAIGSKGTLFVLHSGSMADLLMMLASFLDLGELLLANNLHSCSQATRAWPSAPDLPVALIVA
jgi:hypothetical protein